MRPEKLIHRISLNLLILATSISTYGQTYSGHISNNRKEPVSDAYISLHKAIDSSQIAQTITDAKGYYSLESNSTERLLLRVQVMGYITLWHVCNNAKNDLTLQTDNKMAEVSVTARKPVIEQGADRTIFNVENSSSANGSDAYALLKKTPNVQVMRSQIMVAGKGGVAIMLNGRLQQVSGEDLIQLLRSIPSDNLSKIEVITAPGAKYDAEGTTGIINIVTKKNPKDGFKGSVTAACTRNHYFSPSANTSLQYRKGKLNTVLNLGTGHWNWVYTNRADIYYDTERLYQKIDEEYNNRYSRIQVITDYAIGKNALLGFSYTKGYTAVDIKDHIRTDIYNYSNTLDSTRRTEGTTKDRVKGKNTFNLNYEWRIDSAGKKLNIDADHFSQETTRERELGTLYYIGDQVTPTPKEQTLMTSGSSIRISSVKADLELPYPFIRLSVGGKASVVTNDGSFSYYNLEKTDYVTDSSRANRFLYDENIQALYINGQKNIGRFDIQAGLRMEHTWNKGYTPATKQTNERDYTNLFPSLKLLYKINEQQSVAINYMRRINRPGYGLLNPFRVYYNDNSYTEGNPNLQPSLNHSIELSWLITQKHFLRARTSQIRNYWDRLYITDNTSNVTALTRRNIGNAAYYEFTYGFGFSPAKWWDMNGNITGVYGRFKTRAYGENQILDGTNGWIDISNSFSLNKKKTLMADLRGFYYTPRQKDYKRWEEMSNFEGGIRALLSDKNLILAMAFEDPFAKAYWQQTNYMNGTREYSYDDGRLITLSVTLKFGNNNIKSKKDKSDNNEEIQRAR